MIPDVLFCKLTLSIKPSLRLFSLCKRTGGNVLADGLVQVKGHRESNPYELPLACNPECPTLCTHNHQVENHADSFPRFGADSTVRCDRIGT